MDGGHGAGRVKRRVSPPEIHRAQPQSEDIRRRFSTPRQGVLAAGALRYGLLPAHNSGRGGHSHLELSQTEESPNRAVESERENEAQSRRNSILPLHRSLALLKQTLPNPPVTRFSSLSFSFY